MVFGSVDFLFDRPSSVEPKVVPGDPYQSFDRGYKGPYGSSPIPSVPAAYTFYLPTTAPTTLMFGHCTSDSELMNGSSSPYCVPTPISLGHRRSRRRRQPAEHEPPSHASCPSLIPSPYRAPTSPPPPTHYVLCSLFWTVFCLSLLTMLTSRFPE